MLLKGVHLIKISVPYLGTSNSKFRLNLTQQVTGSLVCTYSLVISKLRVKRMIYIFLLAIMLRKHFLKIRNLVNILKIILGTCLALLVSFIIRQAVKYRMSAFGRVISECCYNVSVEMSPDSRLILFVN